MIVHRVHKGSLIRVKFSPDGRLLATSGDDGSLFVWNISTFDHIVNCHSNFPALNIDFSPGGRFFGYAGSEVSVVDLFSNGNGVTLEQNGFTFGFAFHRTENRIAIHRRSVEEMQTGDDGIWLHELPSGAKLEGLRFPRDEGPRSLHTIRGCQFAPPGELIATCHEIERESGRRPSAQPWRAKRKSEIRIHDLVTRTLDISLKSKEEHVNPSPSSMRISSDGEILAASHGLSIRIWSLRNQERILELKVTGKPIRDICFSKDGSKLLIASNDPMVRIWDTKTWKQVGAYDWQIGKLTCIDVAPDGLRYAAGGSSGKVVVWDAE